jgi:hypothetical protein
MCVPHSMVTIPWFKNVLGRTFQENHTLISLVLSLFVGTVPEFLFPWLPQSSIVTVPRGYIQFITQYLDICGYELSTVEKNYLYISCNLTSLMFLGRFTLPLLLQVTNSTSEYVSSPGTSCCAFKECSNRKQIQWSWGPITSFFIWEIIPREVKWFGKVK